MLATVVSFWAVIFIGVCIYYYSKRLQGAALRSPVRPRAVARPGSPQTAPQSPLPRAFAFTQPSGVTNFIRRRNGIWTPMGVGLSSTGLTDDEVRILLEGESARPLSTQELNQLIQNQIRSRGVRTEVRITTPNPLQEIHDAMQRELQQSLQDVMEGMNSQQSQMLQELNSALADVSLSNVQVSRELDDVFRQLGRGEFGTYTVTTTTTTKKPEPPKLAEKVVEPKSRLDRLLSDDDDLV